MNSINQEKGGIVLQNRVSRRNDTKGRNNILSQILLTSSFLAQKNRYSHSRAFDLNCNSSVTKIQTTTKLMKLQMNPFDIVVSVVFQNAFYLGMHQNNVFFKKKFSFNNSTSKQSENTKNKINLKQRKKLKKFKFF